MAINGHVLSCSKLTKKKMYSKTTNDALTYQQEEPASQLQPLTDENVPDPMEQQVITYPGTSLHLLPKQNSCLSLFSDSKLIGQDSSFSIKMSLLAKEHRSGVVANLSEKLTNILEEKERELTKCEEKMSKYVSEYDKACSEKDRMLLYELQSARYKFVQDTEKEIMELRCFLDSMQ